jgi:hypothetical protein
VQSYRPQVKIETIKETEMRKLTTISALAAASLIAGASAANAYVVIPVCQWVFNGFGWVYLCS